MIVTGTEIVGRMVDVGADNEPLADDHLIERILAGAPDLYE